MKTSALNNQVRITAGQWRNRWLKFPSTAGLRPTPERVRQTVFNWLGQDLTGKHCLDLFAGTGVFGFEAISRNASLSVLVEIDPTAYQSLLHNQALLKADSARILHTNATQFLAHNNDRFDIIFCDPPFHQAWSTKLLTMLSGHLNAEGLLYVEAECAISSSAQWQVLKCNKAGNVFYHLLQCPTG